jgi:FtsH ternary system-associated peptide
VRTVHVEDGVASPLEMLPILPPDRMAEHLARELAALGFVRDGGTCRRTEPDGAEVTVDLAAATVTVKLGAGAKLAESVELSTNTVTESKERTEANLRQAAVRTLDERLEAKTEALRRAVTAQLEAKLADLKHQLDGAVGRATVGALTEKAAQLGRIEETHEDEAGNVTIRVRL